MLRICAGTKQTTASAEVSLEREIPHLSLTVFLVCVPQKPFLLCTRGAVTCALLSAET